MRHISSKYCGRTLALALKAAVLVVTTASLAGDISMADETNVTTYLVKGVFKEPRAGGRQAVIAHEAIPGYMEAMTMPFNVKNHAELDPLKPGDRITFRLSVTETNDWIDQIQRTGETTTVRPSKADSDNSADGLQPGSPVPDCVLTDQSGRPFHLRDFHGKALAFTFFFTRCPLPTFCPRMNNNFAEVQKALQADTGHTNWQLLSISFDPDFDTPSRLQDYGRSFHADPKHWVFATGISTSVHALGDNFGLMFFPEGASITHNLRTVVIDATGRVQKVFTDSEWQPAEAVLEMRKAMQSRP